MSAVERQGLAATVIKKLKEGTTDGQFEIFWEDTMKIWNL